LSSAAVLGTYKDEEDRFYDDPVAFVQQYLLSSEQLPLPKEPASTTELDRLTQQRWWPSHLVMFEVLEPVMQQELAQRGYREVSRCTRVWMQRSHVWVSARVSSIVSSMKMHVAQAMCWCIAHPHKQISFSNHQFP
jgi:hypothetical protein